MGPMRSAREILSPAVRCAVERFHDGLRARFGARLSEVVVFGSHARGEAHEDSDTDVLVVVAEMSDDERSAVFDLAYRIDAGSRAWVGLSPLAYSAAQVAELRERERRRLRDIDGEGIRL